MHGALCSYVYLSGQYFVPGESNYQGALYSCVDIILLHVNMFVCMVVWYLNYADFLACLFRYGGVKHWIPQGTPKCK
jgi:hypothetical protein